MQSPPIKKAFSRRTAATISHFTQTNVQQSFSNIACHCELAAKQPIFETLQSCVCTKVTLSHRFKSSPAIPGNLTVFCTAGYLMMAGHFSYNHVSSGDLNRPRESRGSQTSGVLLVLFVQAKRIKPFPFRELSRFSKPRISPPEQQLPTNKIKTFPKGASRFCKPRISAPKPKLRTNPIKSFRRPWQHFFPPYGGLAAAD